MSSIDEGVVIRIAGDGLAVTVAELGAELQEVVDAAGQDWLWNGDPSWWTGRAPILFPVIGLVNGGVVRVDGRTLPMAKHGFARTRTFAVLTRDDAAVTLRLAADDDTRAAYPFDFTLDIRFAVAGTTLTVEATLANRGAEAMPASFGFHPALRWPLPGAGERAGHVVRFAQPEPAPVRRIDAAGLLKPESYPSPIAGDTLHPADAMFVDDALMFDAPASRELWFGVPGRPGVRLAYDDLPQLGIWTKPGAPYLCLEPWQGINDPEGYTGELRDKPGVIVIAPAAERRFTMRITIGAPAP